MALLKLGATVRTTKPRVDVDPGLKPGKYIARLTVESARGRSQAAHIRIVVLAPPDVGPAPLGAVAGPPTPRRRRTRRADPP